LQEQTIIKAAGPWVMLALFDIEGHDRMQKEKPQFEAIPNYAHAVLNGSKKPYSTGTNRRQRSR
jgi:hypothetical protein